MKIKIAVIAAICLLALISYTSFLQYQNKKLKSENEIHVDNIESLMAGVDTLILKNGQQALQVRQLRLTESEFKEYKKSVVKKIENMGIEIKNLQSFSQHNMQIKIPINAKVDISIPKETEDSLNTDEPPLQLYRGNISVSNKYLNVQGAIIGDSVSLEVVTDVELDQAISIIPKHKFLWWSWGVKSVKQTITTNNPYVKIKYSEYISIHK